ncbi:hypothetical protein [Thermococcus sp. AM4]|uniref:hypothetical protein n=1 Tax=Thermococcus sp. (strain AM4) TaxID=246969 RepID=UPI000186FA3A|nr:hypothetical protein [Thermococcus sp. AM4]EEB74758.1 hypothetical protein TAM4_703 [Thermococcus sp. AM4]
MNRTVLVGLLFAVLFLAPLVIADELNAIEIKVYNVNTNHVYFDKVVPRDRPYHTVIHFVDGSTQYNIDLTYDPHPSHVVSNTRCIGNVCNVTVVDRGGFTQVDNIGIRMSPTHADFGTKASLPSGLVIALGVLLTISVLRR